MEVTVRFFGNLTRAAGGRTLTIRVDGDRPTVAELRNALAREVPQIASQLPQAAVGVGADLLGDDATLDPDSEVALLPPVSGGLG